MPSFSISEDFEFEVFCGGCGSGLCSQSTTGETRGRRMPFVSVEPCKVCLEEARDKGRLETEDK